MPETSVIHDLGYQRYAGARLGRGYAWRTLYLHTLRTSFGLGRGVKAKLFSWSIIGIILGTGVILTAVSLQTKQPVMSYPEFVDQVVLLSILFLGIVAPELVSRDRQTGVLALYFARPMRRSDYALARLAGLVSALWLTLAAPLVVMFAGDALSADGPGDVGKATGHLLQGLAHAATHALLLGAVSLLIASFLRRRAVAAAAIAGLFLLGTPLVGFIASLDPGAGTSELVSMINPPTALTYLNGWLYNHGTWPYSESHHVMYGPLLGAYAVAIIAASAALLVARYRKVAP
jgi:ABC-2 type transport system permease protein